MKFNARTSSESSLYVCLFICSECKPLEGKMSSYTRCSCTVIGWKGIKDTVPSLNKGHSEWWADS